MDKKRALLQFLQARGQYTDVSFEDFSADLDNPEWASALHAGMKADKILGSDLDSYDNFATTFGIKKKTQPGAESGVGSQEVSLTPPQVEAPAPPSPQAPGPQPATTPPMGVPTQEQVSREQLARQRQIAEQTPLVLSPERYKQAEQERAQPAELGQIEQDFPVKSPQSGVADLQRARSERMTGVQRPAPATPTGEMTGTAYKTKTEKRPVFGPSGDIIRFDEVPVGSAVDRERTLNSGLKLSEAYTLLKLRGEIPKETKIGEFVSQYAGNTNRLTELDTRISGIQQEKEQEKQAEATRMQEEYTAGVSQAKQILETRTGQEYSEEQVRKMLEEQFGIYAPGTEPVESIAPEKLKVPESKKSGRWTSGFAAGAKVILPGVMSTLRQASLFPEFIMDTYTDIFADRDGEITRLVDLQKKGLVEPEIVKEVYDKRKKVAKAVLDVNSLFSPALLGAKVTNAIQEEIGTKERAERAKQRYQEAAKALEQAFSDEKSMDLLRQGRYKDFFIKTSADATSSIPSFAISMLPVAGPAIMGASTMKSKYDDIKEQYGDVMTAEGATNAIVTGTLDGIGARFTAGIGKVAAELAKKVGTTAAKRTMGTIITDIAKKAGGATLTEGGEEALVKLGENIVDKATINPDQDLGEGVLESAAAGAFLGPIPIALGGGIKIARFRGEQKEYNKQLLLNAIDAMTKSHQAFYDPKDVSADTVNETVDAYLSDLAQSIVSRSKGKYDEKTVLQSPEYLAIANNREQIVNSISQAVGLAETFSQLSEAEQAFSSYLDTIESQGTKVRTDEDIQNALTNFYQANPDAAKEESRLLMVGRAFASQKQEQDATQKVENLQPQGGELQPVGTEEGQQVQGTGQEAQPGTDAGDLAAVGGMQAGQVTAQPPVDGAEQPTVAPAEGVTAQPEPTAVAPTEPAPTAPTATQPKPVGATPTTPTPAWTTPSIAINKTTVYSGSPLSNGLFVKRKTSKDIKKGETFYVITPNQLNENKGAFDLSRDVETAQAALDALEENITNAFDIEGDVTGRITVDMIDQIIPGEVKMFRRFDDKTKKYREYWRITEKGKIILKKPSATPAAPTTSEPTPTAPTAAPEPTGVTPEPTPAAPTAAPTAAGVTPTEPGVTPTAAPTAPATTDSPYAITGKRREVIRSPADRRKKIPIYDSAQTTVDELLNEFEKQGEKRWIDEKEFRRIHERVLTVSRILSRFGIKIYFTAKMENSSNVVKGAYFNKKLGGGKQYIVISAKDATVSTVVHEAFHAIIRNGKLSSTQVVKDLYNPIMNILKNNPDTVETYNKIQDWLRGAKYERGQVPEEFLAQLSGYISDGIGKKPLDKSVIAKLEKVINDVLEKLLGKDVLVVRFSDKTDVIDFFNTLTDGLTTGDTALVERALELYESGRVTNPRKTIYFKGTEIPNGRKFVENVLNALERIESESAKYPQGGVINELTIIDGIQRIINNTLKLIPGLEKTSITINTGKDARNLIVEMSDKNTIQGKKIGATAKKIQDAIADIVLAINDYLASRGNDPQLEEYKLDPIDGQDTVQSDINAEMMPEEVRNPDKTQFNKQQEMVKSIQEAISNLDRERQKIAFAIRNKAKFVAEKTRANVLSSSMKTAGIPPILSELLTGITSDVVGNPRISIGARTAKIKKNIGTGESGTLSSFLSFSDMYDLIPQLADYTVKHDAAVGNGQATIDLDARTISVGDMNTEQDFFIAMMNEVRYAAQDFELFEAGVTPEGSLDAQEVFAAMRTQINMHVKQLQDKLDQDKKAGMNEQFIADSQAILDEAKAQATQINSIGDRTTYFNYVRSTTPSISSDALAKMNPSDRTNILADQMDFDGTTEELLFEVADTEQFASQDSMVKSRKIFDQTKFISVANAMQRLATVNPDYLRPVLNSIREMRRRTRNGELQPSDVAKAWMMSVASQQAGPVDAATANKHLASKGINVVLDESVFAESYSVKDRKTKETVIKRGGIRPEAMAAMMLSSSMGRKFLSDLNKGQVDTGFIDRFIDAISLYGMQNKKRESIIGTGEKKGIYQIGEVTQRLNEIGKKGPEANEEFYKELMTLGMIKEGKAGFMGQFLGISDRGVIDSRQLDFWIENGGDGEKKISDKASAELIARIGMVAKRLGFAEEDAYIAHHLIWDKVGGIEVVHQSMYELMMDYNLQDEQNMMFEMAENSVPDTLSSSIKSNPNFRPAVRLIDTYLNDDTSMTPYSTDHELARALIMQFGFSPYEARQLIEHRAGRRYMAAHPMTVDADASYEAMVHYFKQASVWSKEGREKWKQFAYSLDLWAGNYLTGVRTLMNQLTKQAGAGTTPSELNAYAALQNMRGKSAFRIMNYRDKFIGDPESVSSKRDSFIGRLSSALGKGATETFNKFMIAQHQEERYDRLIAKQLKKISEMMRVMTERDLEAQEKQDAINALSSIMAASSDPAAVEGQMKRLEAEIEKLSKKNESVRNILETQKEFLDQLEQRKMSAIEFREKVFDEMTPEQLAKAREFYAEFKRDYVDEFVNVLLDGGIISQERADYLLNGTTEDDPVGWQFYVPLLIEESAYADEYGEFQSPMDGAPNGKSYATIANPGVQRLRGAVAFGEQDIQNILHVVFDKLTRATVLAEQNLARQTMADMLQQYPSQTLYVDSKGNEHPRYQVISSRARPVVNEFGEVVGVDDYTPEVVKKQSIQFIDKDGKMKYMFFANANDPVLLGARAKPSEFSAMGKGIIKGLNILNNVFRPLITQFSPTFIIQNPFRDVQEALISIDTEGKQIRPTSRKLKRSLLKNYFKAIAFFAGNTWLAKAMGVDNKTSKSAWRRQMYDMWMEVQQEGGRMSWAMLGTNPTESMESLQKSMLDAELAATANPSNEQVESWMQGVQSDIAAKQAEIDAIIAASTTTTTTAATTGTTTALSAEDKAKVAKLTAQKKTLELKLKAVEKTVNAAGQVVYRVKNPKFLIKDAFLQLSKLSDFTENLSRLAAHTTVREAGGSPREGAMVARNITINFEKRGLADALRAGNAGWLFLNVGIQGARRFGKLLANPEGRKAMLTLIILSAANRALFHAFTDDEEEEYNKKKYIYSDYIGRNKTLVHNPFNPNAPIMIPKAYGLSRLAYTLGEGMVDMAYELKSPGDIAIDATMDILTAVDPIGGGSSAPVNYLPVAALSPLFQVAFNQDYMGNEIMRSYGFSSSMMPDYQKKYKTTEEWAVKFAEEMYNIPIGPDVSPITIEFLAKEYGGLGPARFLQNINDMAKLAEENGEQLGIDKVLLSTIKPLYREDISEKAAYDMYILLDVVRQSGARSAITGIPEGKKKFMKDALDHVRQKELMKPQQIVQMKKALKARYPDETEFIDGL